MCRQEIQEFSATAADVQHRPSVFEQRHVGFEPCADDFTRTSELVLEADVLVGVESGRMHPETAFCRDLRNRADPGSGCRLAESRSCGSPDRRRHALQSRASPSSTPAATSRRSRGVRRGRGQRIRRRRASTRCSRATSIPQRLATLSASPLSAALSTSDPPAAVAILRVDVRQ